MAIIWKTLNKLHDLEKDDHLQYIIDIKSIIRKKKLKKLKKIINNGKIM